MELWVRSQDKMNLVKIRQISLNYQNNKQVIANYEPEQYENSSCFYELLGTYKTQDRALEVLDEIQELIKPKQIITTYESEIKEGINKSTFDVVMTPKIDNIQLIEPTTLIYEMPID